MRIVPCPISNAQEFVRLHHRHHGPPPSATFSCAVADDEGVVHGVVLVGRPVARLLDDGATLEVNRCCTDGTPHACSMLYGAARRIAKELGFTRLFTYTRQDEAGASLRGAGWVLDDPDIRARSWNMPSRPRTDRTEITKRQRWRIDLSSASPPLRWPQAETNQLCLLSVAALSDEGKP